MTKNLFRNSSRAQAIVLIAMAFAGLVGIVGLMTDGGMLLVEYARLKRAVDAASLGAAQQYRKDYSPSALTNAATEVLQLNQSDVIPGDTLVQTCSDVPGDPALCTTPLRKLVRVTATRHINFGFLRIFGINSTDITTSAIGEAASVDLVFVIDTSISMASETNYDRNGHSCTWTDSQGSVTLFNCENIDDRAILDRGDNHVIDIGDDPKDCNQGVGGYCQPMADVKSIAQTFADKLFYPYDRVGVVALTGQQTDGSAARNPVSVLDLSPSKASVDSAIENLVVFQPRVCPQPLDGSPYPCLNYPDGINFVGQECPMYRSTSPNDPSSCNSTDAGTGLLEAEAQLTDPAQERTNSFWAVVLLLSGPPNSSLPSAADQAAYPYGYCPPSTWDPSLPFCTQPHIDYTIYPPNPNPTHEYGYSPLVPGASPDASYTSLDFAMDAADYVAAPTVGAGASIYAIGLGNRVRHLYNGDPNLAEEFMLYAAKYAGGGGSDVRHGAYYYAQTATDLGPIFNDIYNNITTRISQ